jgi:hypothetical protein
VWGVTGVYLIFPEPFQRGIHRVFPLNQYRPVPSDAFLDGPRGAEISAQVTYGADVPPPRPRRRPPIQRTFGDQVIRWIYYLHFGNFGGWSVKGIWTLFGLAPVLLFVTGVVMWWNRVLSPSARRARRKVELASVAGD